MPKDSLSHQAFVVVISEYAWPEGLFKGCIISGFMCTVSLEKFSDGASIISLVSCVHFWIVTPSVGGY